MSLHARAAIKASKKKKEEEEECRLASNLASKRGSHNFPIPSADDPSPFVGAPLYSSTILVDLKQIVIINLALNIFGAILGKPNHKVM